MSRWPSPAWSFQYLEVQTCKYLSKVDECLWNSQALRLAIELPLVAVFLSHRDLQYRQTAHWGWSPVLLARSCWWDRYLDRFHQGRRALRRLQLSPSTASLAPAMVYHSFGVHRHHLYPLAYWEQVCPRSSHMLPEGFLWLAYHSELGFLQRCKHFFGPFHYLVLVPCFHPNYFSSSQFLALVDPKHQGLCPLSVHYIY